MRSGTVADMRLGWSKGGVGLKSGLQCSGGGQGHYNMGWQNSGGAAGPEFSAGGATIGALGFCWGDYLDEVCSGTPVGQYRRHDSRCC